MSRASLGPAGTWGVCFELSLDQPQLSVKGSNASFCKESRFSPPVFGGSHPFQDLKVREVTRETLPVDEIGDPILNVCSHACSPEPSKL